MHRFLLVMDFHLPPSQTTCGTCAPFLPLFLAPSGTSERTLCWPLIGLINDAIVLYMAEEEQLVNPFRSLRVAARMTLGELSTNSKIDIRSLSRSEYGMYTNPLPALVEYWVRRGSISEGVLTSEYEYYKIAVRRHHRLLFGPTLDFSLTSNIHPMRQFRAQHDFGLVELCKALCLPMDTLQYFEKKWRNQQSVPKGVLLALNQAGYSQFQLRRFQDEYKKWRLNQSAVVFS